MAEPLWKRIFGRNQPATQVPPVVQADQVKPERIREFIVMVSSPRQTFTEERAQIWDALRAFPGITPYMFDAVGRPGLSNKDWSIEMVRGCDLFIALFDEYTGSPLADDPTKTHSQLEVEEVQEQHDKNGHVPPILIYRRKPAEGTTPPAPAPWQEVVEKRFAPKPFDSPKDLANLIVAEVGAIAFARRSREADALLEQRERIQAELASLQNKHDVEVERRERETALRQQVERDQKSLSQTYVDHGREVRQMYVQALNESARGGQLLARQLQDLEQRFAVVDRDHRTQLEVERAASRKHFDEQLSSERRVAAELTSRFTDLGRQLAERQRWRVRGALVAVLLGAVIAFAAGLPWVGGLFAATQAVKEARDALRDVFGSGLGSIAAAIDDIEVATSGCLDSSMTCQKIDFARRLDKSFDCRDANRDWVVQIPVPSQSSPAARIEFSTETICRSPGAIDLHVATNGSDLCEMDLLSEDAARWISEQIDAAGLMVARLEVVGHASTDAMRTGCEVPPPTKAVLDACGGSPIAAADAKVNDNDLLARVRAVLARCRMGEALKVTFSGTSVNRPVKSVSVFDSHRTGNPAADLSASRRVRLELLLTPRPRPANVPGTTTAASAQDTAAGQQSGS